MSEGADSVTRTCGNSLATSSTGESDATSGTATPPPSPLSPPPPPSPSTTTRYTTGRRPRFGTGGPPPSPYVWVDGRQLRSALAWTNKWPTRPPGALPLRVNFPANDNHLVTGYLEPANPWRHGEYCPFARYILVLYLALYHIEYYRPVSLWSISRSASCVNS